MAFEWGPFSDKALTSIDESNARLNFWQGAVRSSKSVSADVRWLEYMTSGPSGALIMVGKTERSLKRNVLDPLEQMTGGGISYRVGAGEFDYAGRKVYVAGASDERAVSKIQGLTVAGAYGDEVTTWPESFFKMLLSRMSVRGAKGFFTLNPESPYHWLKTEFLNREDDLNLLSWAFTLDDNLTLDPEYVEDLKNEYTGVWYDRFILGRWVVAEGRVYDTFDPDGSMVVDILPTNFERVVVGVDYGTANATVFLKLGLANGKWWLFDEYTHDSRAAGRQKTDAEYAEEFIEWCAPYVPRSIEVDPSAASFKLALKRRGVGNVTDANNDVLDGIRTTATALTSGTLLISRRCRRTIESLSVYAWDSKAQQRGEDKPLKENDHHADALRYAVMRVLGQSGRTRLRVRR